MFERMLDKEKEPSRQEIQTCLGEDSYERLCALEAGLEEEYHLKREICFPFGNEYGWGYKYSHGSFHLCYAFFERGAFTVMLQIGDKQVAAVEGKMDVLSPKAKALWEGRYPCGERGGWIHMRVLNEGDMADVTAFIHSKKTPTIKNRI